MPDGYDQVDIFRMLMRCLGGVRERRKRRQKYDLAGTIQLIKEAKKILVLTGAGISGKWVYTCVKSLLQYLVAFPTSVHAMAFMLS